MIFGIDLGTTNSLIAYYDNGDSIVLPNELGKLLTPSVVNFSKDRTAIIGDAANEMRITHAETTFSAFKREMGTSRSYQIGQKEYTPSLLSSLVLKKLIAYGERALNMKIQDVIISVPAYFNDRQRKDTIEAARQINLNVVGLISEPTAAALAYHLQESKDETIIAVVDMGGGTFDVSILDIFDSVIEVEAVSGDNYLGGEDFDLAIYHAIIDKYEIDDSTLSSKDKMKLMYIARDIKMAFDTDKSVAIDVTLEVLHVKISFDLEAFIKICEPVLSRIRKPINQAVRDAGFSLKDIDEVVLVGGSTKMPLVKKEISRLFGRLPLSHLNPELVVAKGAAVYGEMRMRNIELKEMVLTDVCPYTLGSSVTKTLTGNLTEHIFDPIIERNMTVPISREKLYYPFKEYQRSITIDVYQGEQRDPKNNIHLGNINIDFEELINRSEGAVKVRFTYDINGILEVMVTWLSTGETQKAILMNNNKLSDEAVQKRMDELEAIKIHPVEREENLYILSKAEKLYELSLGQHRQFISDEINQFKSALYSQDDQIITKGVERMYEVFQQFEGR